MHIRVEAEDARNFQKTHVCHLWPWISKNAHPISYETFDTTLLELVMSNLAVLVLFLQKCKTKTKTVFILARTRLRPNKQDQDQYQAYYSLGLGLGLICNTVAKNARLSIFFIWL